MEYDELELDTLGEEKTALFVIISDTDATFNFVVSIMYSQLFNLLCDKADDVYNGRLPVHVCMLLDEFANIGQIPQFEKLMAIICGIRKMIQFLENRLLFRNICRISKQVLSRLHLVTFLITGLWEESL